ncbi:phage tail protein [Nocardia terpenica]|uniref:Phage tail protein n=2 Tax=Nocardia terpenica TaxID=455432 RepID=A0A6G9Z734_9NOCA|nr:phage tail protein [Nocardia terpenica]
MESDLCIELESCDKRSDLEIMHDEKWNGEHEADIIAGTVKARGPRTEWFTLHGENAGNRGVYLGQNPEGIFDEPTESIWNSHAYQIGASWGGIRVHKRDVILGAEIIGTDNAPWQDNDSEWRKAWSYEKDSRLWVTTPHSRRYLELRLSETPKFTPDISPFTSQYGKLVMTCVAGNPRWYEQDYTYELIVRDGEVAYVPVWNPTDTRVWLKWVLQNRPGAIYSLPDFSFGSNRFGAAALHERRMVPLPKLVAADGIVRVDTDEDAEQVTADGGTQIWMRMFGCSFLYPIPPYTGTEKDPVQLPVAVKGADGECEIQARLQRSWSRPWGLQ